MNCACKMLHKNIYNVYRACGRLNFLIHLKNYQLVGIRALYGPSSLGLDTFVKLNGMVKEEYGDTNSFLNRIKNDLEIKKISIEDLKLLISCCSEDKSLLGRVLKFSKIYFDNAKLLPMRPYSFGPIIMRLLYSHDEVDEALQLFLDEEYGHFFNQISSYHVIMDKLYKISRYEEVKVLMNKLIYEEKLSIPISCLTLTMGANYKIGTEEALEDSMKLIELVTRSKGQIQIRPIAFAAALALKLGKNDMALEILGHSHSANHFLIINLSILAKTRLKQVDDVLKILKKKILSDLPTSSRHVHKLFCCDVIKEIEEAANDTLEMEKIQEIKHLKQVLESMQLMNTMNLDEILCAPVEDRSLKVEKRSLNKLNG